MAKCKFLINHAGSFVSSIVVKLNHYCDVIVSLVNMRMQDMASLFPNDFTVLL